jgi:hypothetical protein
MAHVTNDDGRRDTAYEDQLEAARQHTDRLFAATGKTPGVQVHHGGVHPEWLISKVFAFETALEDGDGLLCRHLAEQPDGPQPVWGAAWRPNVAVCSQCQEALTRDMDEEYPCAAGCGRTLRFGIGFTMQIQHDLVIYTYAVCRPCVEAGAA